ncbi:MAG: histidine triad nucleotide-binding protein [Patescibacteria group bacterium]
MGSCIFCSIIKGEVASEIVYESDEFIVIKDIAPKAPVHLLLMPKRHIETLNDMRSSDSALLGAMHYKAIQLAARFGIAESGYKIITNTGADGGQVVKHVHIHLLGGKKLSGEV